jgi:hypothetical protein
MMPAWLKAVWQQPGITAHYESKKLNFSDNSASSEILFYNVILLARTT